MSFGTLEMVLKIGTLEMVLKSYTIVVWYIEVGVGKLHITLINTILHL